MSGIKIEKSISEDDIPDVQGGAGKYAPIYRACKHLEKGEGMQIRIDEPHSSLSTHIRKYLNKKFKHRYYTVAGRKRNNTYRLYIIRKS